MTLSFDKLFHLCFFKEVELLKLAEFGDENVDILIWSTYTPEVLGLLLEKFTPAPYSQELYRMYRGTKGMVILLKDKRFEVNQEMREQILLMGNLDEIRCCFERRPPNQSTVNLVINRGPVLRLIMDDKRFEFDPSQFKTRERFIFRQMEVLCGKWFFHGRIPMYVLQMIREFLSFIPLWRYPLSGVMFFNQNTFLDDKNGR